MWLTPEQARTLITHARAEAPNEACGIIVGQKDRVVEIIPIPNTAADPTPRYITWMSAVWWKRLSACQHAASI